MLAVSVGSEHGQSSRLNLDLLAAIDAKVHAPLVLHGGSGIHEDDVRAAVRLGVVKINIGAALSRAWRQGRVKGWRLARITTACSARAMQRVHEVARHRLATHGRQRSRLSNLRWFRPAPAHLSTSRRSPA
jgi:fructose/tagatose bisphosphate aldolase